MPKKVLTKPNTPALVNVEIEETKLSLNSKTLEEQAQLELDPDLLKKIKKISYYISINGLDLEESCMLSDVIYEEFKTIMVESDLVKKIIDMKTLQYKKDLLFIVNQKALEGDDKLSLWLLERRYPDEYGPTKKSSKNINTDDSDILTEAIEFVQETSDDNPMIKRTSARAIVIKKKGAKTSDLIKKLKDTLV